MSPHLDSVPAAKPGTAAQALVVQGQTSPFTDGKVKLCQPKHCSEHRARPFVPLGGFESHTGPAEISCVTLGKWLDCSVLLRKL